MPLQLLLEHLDAISPDLNDLLHELLQALGDVPDREALLGTVTECTCFIIKERKMAVMCLTVEWSHFFISGEGAVDPNDPNRESTLSHLAKMEVSLTLTSKFELLEGDDKDLKTLMTKLVCSCNTLPYAETVC